MRSRHDHDSFRATCSRRFRSEPKNMNSVLISYLVSDFIFLATGVLLIVAPVIWQRELSAAPTQESVGRVLLLQRCPLPGMALRDPPYSVAPER